MVGDDQRLLYRVNPDVLALTGIPRTTVFEHMSAGLLETFKVGKRRFCTREALEEYIRRLAGEQRSSEGAA